MEVGKVYVPKPVVRGREVRLDIPVGGNRYTLLVRRNRVKVLDTSGRPQPTLREVGFGLSFSPDGRWLVADSEYGTNWTLVDLKHGLLLEASDCRDVGFWGGRPVWLTDDAILQVYEEDRAEPPSVPLPHSTRLLTLSADGRDLLAVYDQGVMRLTPDLRMENIPLPDEWAHRGATLEGFSVVDLGDRLAGAVRLEDGPTVWITWTSQGEARELAALHDGNVWSWRVGHYLFLATEGRFAWLWDPNDIKPMGPVVLPPSIPSPFYMGRSLLPGMYRHHLLPMFPFRDRPILVTLMPRSGRHGWLYCMDFATGTTYGYPLAQYPDLRLPLANRVIYTHVLMEDGLLVCAEDGPVHLKTQQILDSAHRLLSGQVQPEAVDIETLLRRPVFWKGKPATEKQIQYLDALRTQARQGLKRDEVYQDLLHKVEHPAALPWHRALKRFVDAVLQGPLPDDLMRWEASALIDLFRGWRYASSVTQEIIDALDMALKKRKRGEAVHDTDGYMALLAFQDEAQEVLLSTRRPYVWSTRWCPGNGGTRAGQAASEAP